MEFRNVRSIEIVHPDWKHWWDDSTMTFPRNRYDLPISKGAKPIRVKFSDLSLRLGIQKEF